MQPTVTYGSMALGFILHEGTTGRPWSSPRNTPWVLAFVRGWAPERERSKEALIRERLRELDATMIVVSEHGVWWCRPSEDVELCAAAHSRLTAEALGLAMIYGVPLDHDAVFVIDQSGTVRVAHATRGSLSHTLITALEARPSRGLVPGVRGRDRRTSVADGGQKLAPIDPGVLAGDSGGTPMELQRASTATWSGPGGRLRGRERVAPRRYERLGVYQVKGLLGVGGMARVYLGENTLVERPVAIKRLLPELAHHPEAHAMFLREARIAGAIRHPNLLEIYDFGYDAEGRPYFVMELARGDTLAERLDAGPLLLSRALDFAIAITDAVTAIHANGYLHRDIKADNVMLACDDRRLTPKLIDFGIACKIDGASEMVENVVGTPRIMAPEQVARDRVDPRTDIWGLGVLLYEMIAGRLPFDAHGSVRDDLLAIVTETPHPLPRGVDPDICSVVEACLSKDPDDRPATAAGLAEELREVQERYLASRGMITRRRR